MESFISDPFVKVSLCQNGKVMKSRKTSIKKNTIDPVFNESINFNVTPDMLDCISLVVTVWDHNSKSRDDFVGRIILGRQATGQYELNHWNRMMQCHRSPIAQWHTLRPREECDPSSSPSSSISWAVTSHMTWIWPHDLVTTVRRPDQDNVSCETSKNKLMTWCDPQTIHDHVTM